MVGQCGLMNGRVRTRVSAATLKLRQSTQGRGELQPFSSGAKYEHVPPSLLLTETPRSTSAWLEDNDEEPTDTSDE